MKIDGIPKVSLLDVQYHVSVYMRMLRDSLPKVYHKLIERVTITLLEQLVKVAKNPKYSSLDKG